MAKSFFDSLNVSTSELKTQRVGNFIKNSKDYSNMLLSTKEMQVRQLENDFERTRDLGDDTTMSIASRISKADPKEVMTNLHKINVELQQARQELEWMKQLHAELYPETGATPEQA